MDLLTTLVPHLNCMIGLETVKTLLSARLAVPSSPTLQKAPASSASQSRKCATFLSVVFRVVIFVWGVAVVCLHFDARYNVTQAERLPSCKLSLAPWRIHSSGKTACAVVYVNCYRLQIMSRVSEIETVLEALELGDVAPLGFGHCPHLELPSMLRQMSKLASVDIFNSTLVSWDAEAALAETHHPLMNHMYMVHTNISAIPDALVHSSLPRAFQYLHFYDTNLTDLPDTVNQMWEHHEWVTLGFINKTLWQLPDNFGWAHIQNVHLLNAKIDRFSPSVARVLPILSRLRISGPDFQELPTHVDILEGRSVLPLGFFIQNTSVNSLPDWVIDYVVRPYCRGPQGNILRRSSVLESKLLEVLRT